MNSACPDSGREVSAGIISVRFTSGRKSYLLLKHANGGHWSFSKGHLEEGEEAKDAALRELREETSLEVKKFFSGFKEKSSYSYEREGLSVAKTVIYYLGRVPPGSAVKLSDEHLGYRWLNYREARELLTYENDRELLDEAEEKLKSVRGGNNEN